MEHRVFISHSSADRHIASAICHYLEESGIRCWIAPRDIDTIDWAGSIMRALALELDMEKNFGSQCPYVLRLREKGEAL